MPHLRQICILCGRLSVGGNPDSVQHPHLAQVQSHELAVSVHVRYHRPPEMDVAERQVPQSRTAGQLDELVYVRQRVPGQTDGGQL